MLNDFRPVNAVNKLPSEKVEQSKTFINDVHQNAELEIHQCLNFDNYLIVKCDTDIKSDTIVSIKNPRKFKDISEEFAKEFRSTIRKIKQKLKLTNKQIRELKRELNKSEVKQMELTNQIKHIEGMAKAKKKQSNLEKVYRNYMKRYQAFSESLNNDILKLEVQHKEDIKVTLQKIEKVIQEYQGKLS